MTRRPLLRHYPFEPSMQAARDRVVALGTTGLMSASADDPAPPSRRRIAGLRAAIGAQLVGLGSRLIADDEVRRRAARRRLACRQLGVGSATR